MKISIVQMCSSNTLAYNERQLFSQLEKVPQGVELVFTPENVLYLAVPAHPSETGRPACVFDFKESVFDRLKQYCAGRKCEIVLGSVPMEDNTGVYNATCVVDAHNINVVYKKIHLFDVDVGGEISLRESASYQHGAEPCVIDIKSWRLGLSICYDVRFAELYSHYARQQVDIICVPAAFLVRTGRAHWHTLLRARAIESQAFVIAAAQCGVHQSQTSSHTRKSFGHSLIISPWGEVLAEAGPDTLEVLSLELDKHDLRKVRQQIPMHEHRRLSLS